MNAAQKTRSRETRPAAELVAEALAAHPGCTAAELANFSGLGQSTVSKSLASLETAGAAKRDLDAQAVGRRTAARWSPITRTRPHQKTAASAAGSAGSLRGGRLRPGQLGTLALEHLIAHRDQDWSPTAVGKALGRSSGAVANALAKFEASGDVVLTSEAPRRYQIATH